MTRMHYMS